MSAVEMNAICCSPYETRLDVETHRNAFHAWTRGVTGSEGAQEVGRVITSHFEVEKRSKKTIKVVAYTRLFHAAQLALRSQFDAFEMMEPTLKKPSSSATSSLCQWNDAEFSCWCEQYYAFDEALMRECVGLKMRKMTRNELDVVAQKCGIRTHSASRQWENLRRIYCTRWPEEGASEASFDEERVNALTDGGRERAERMSLKIKSMLGSIRSSQDSSSSFYLPNAAKKPVEECLDTSAINSATDDSNVASISSLQFIASVFKIPVSLARQYAIAVFLCRIRLVTTGKRIQSLTFADLERIAAVLMSEWCLTSQEALAQSYTSHNINNATNIGAPLQSPSPQQSSLGRVSLTQSQPFIPPANLFDRQFSLSVLNDSFQIPNLQLERGDSGLEPPSTRTTTSPAVIYFDVALSQALRDETSPLTDVIDAEFINDLRHVKTLVSEQRKICDDHTTCVLQLLKSRFGSTDRSGHRPRIVLACLRALLAIAYSLSKTPKKLRTLLVDLAEQVVKPFLKLNVTLTDFCAVMEAIQEGFQQIPEVMLRFQMVASTQDKNITPTTPYSASLEVTKCFKNVQRFLNACCPIACIIYHSNM